MWLGKGRSFSACGDTLGTVLVNTGMSKARLPQRHFRLAHIDMRQACMICHNSANQAGARAHGPPKDHGMRALLQRLRACAHRHVGVAAEVEGGEAGEDSHVSGGEGALKIESAHIQAQQRAVCCADLAREGAPVGEQLPVPCVARLPVRAHSV